MLCARELLQCGLQRRAQAARTYFSFLTVFAERRCVPAVGLSHLDLRPFISLPSRQLSPFHLKEAPDGISEAHLSRQHRYTRTLGPLGSKTRVT